MRRLPFLLVVLSTCYFRIATVQAQSVDEILTSYFEMTGGLNNWKNLKSMKITGKMIQQGMEFPAVITQKFPNKSRMDINIQGKTITQSYDGSEGWMVNPLAQIMEPKKLTAEELGEMEDQEIEDDFINYKEKGHTVELEGAETIEGTECHKVKLIKKSGEIEYHFFDKDNSVPLMVRTFIKSGPMKGQPTETFLGEYDTAGDFLMPFSMTTKYKGEVAMQIKVDSYEINPALADSFFAFPAE